MNHTHGEFDCPNPNCSKYHELRRCLFIEFKPPKCRSCHKRMRLVRVLRALSPEARQRLDALRSQRKGACVMPELYTLAEVMRAEEQPRKLSWYQVFTLWG